MIGGPAVTRRVEDYVVSYGVNDGQPVVVAVGAPAFGTGVAFKGDVVRLLASLPDRGEIFFRIAARQGGALEGRYALGGLKSGAGPAGRPLPVARRRVAQPMIPEQRSTYRRA